MTMKFTKGQTVVTGAGFPAVVISNTKGIRTMCAVFGWEADYGDVWTAELREISWGEFAALTKENGFLERAEKVRLEYLGQHQKAEAAKARKAANKIAA